MTFESENVEFRSQMVDAYTRITNGIRDAILVARQMCDAGLIVALGRGANKKYKIKL